MNKQGASKQGVGKQVWGGIGLALLLSGCVAPGTPVLKASEQAPNGADAATSSSLRVTDDAYALLGSDAPLFANLPRPLRLPPPLKPLQRMNLGEPGAGPLSRVEPIEYDPAATPAGPPATDDEVAGSLPDIGAGGARRKVFERGGASWYGLQFHRKLTASGERFDMGALTAAHKTLPFGSMVCVQSLVNGREVMVRINDRGPYAGGRVIDLSQAAADAIDMVALGIKSVALSVVGKGERCGDRVNDKDNDDASAAMQPAPPPPVGAPGAKKPRHRKRHGH